jgi:predicted DNA-binding transcriptional regulator AlpA
LDRGTAVTKKYLTCRQVAERYPISVSSLAQLASRGAGPRFYKPVNVALYLAEEVEAWIEEAVVMPQTEAPVGEGASSQTHVRVLDKKTAETGSAGSHDIDDPRCAFPKARHGRPRKDIAPSADSVLRQKAKNR